MSDKFRDLSTEWSHGTDGCPPSGQGRTKAPWPSAPKTFRRVDTLRSSPLSSRAIWERGIPAFFANAAWVSSARLRKYQRQRLSGQRPRPRGALSMFAQGRSKSGFANASLRRTARAESEISIPYPYIRVRGWFCSIKLKLTEISDNWRLTKVKVRNLDKTTRNGPEAEPDRGLLLGHMGRRIPPGPGGLRTNLREALQIHLGRSVPGFP